MVAAGADGLPKVKKLSMEKDLKSAAETLEEAVREVLAMRLGHEPDSDEMASAAQMLRGMAQENKRMAEEYERLFEVLERDPRLAIFFSEMMKGVPVRVALVKSDIFDFAPQSGDDDWEAYQRELAESKRKRQEYLQALEEHKHNCDCTAHVVSRFYDEKGLSDDECDSFADYIEGVFADVVRGIIDRQTLERLWHGYTMETRLQEAHDKGVLDGRNMRIEELRNSVQTDGLPASSGGVCTTSAKRGYIERIMRGEY